MEIDLHYSFVLFLDDISFIFMPGMTILMLGWLACPAWLLSLSHYLFSPCRAWTFRVSPSLPLFQKMRRVILPWHNPYEHEAIFLMSLLPLFQLMNLHVIFSCPCNIKRFITINLSSYTALNYMRAWRKRFHAETINFQDLSWNFSFQAVYKEFYFRYT